MMLCTDRDLLAFEPNVFVDVPIASQELLRAEDGAIDGSTLSSPTSDFAALGVETGHVVVVNGLSLEVIDRPDPQTVTVSLPRSDAGGPVQTPPLSGTIEFAVRTFRPQAVVAHQHIRRALDLAEGDYNPASDQAVLLDTAVGRRLEVLATLAEIYRAAQAPLNADPIFASRQRHYEQALARALAESAIAVDLDGDGVADRMVTTGVRTLRRI